MFTFVVVDCSARCVRAANTFTLVAGARGWRGDGSSLAWRPRSSTPSSRSSSRPADPSSSLAAVLGTANAVSRPTEVALVPAVVAEERWQTANAHIETARFAGFAAGPLLGGVLAGFGGTRLPRLVDAASFLVIATAVSLAPRLAFCSLIARPTYRSHGVEVRFPLRASPICWQAQGPC